MSEKKRRSLGVFINKSDTYFENSLYETAQNMARVMGYDIYFFCTVGHRDSINSYDRHEKSMFSFAPVDQLDGILVAPDNYELHGFKDSLFAMLDSCSCPVVCIRYRHYSYSCVYTVEENAIEPLLEHIVDAHGLTNVGFVSGYEGHKDAEMREQCFLRFMEKRGLPLPEGCVYHGSMWTNDADLIYKHYFEDIPVRPDAIICANDYMAHALINECSRHGVHVPEDVIITGFDNVPSFTAPTITSVGQDYDRMITEAMQMLDRKIRDRELGLPERQENILLQGSMHVKESCGCEQPTLRSYWDKTTELNIGLEKIKSREVSQTYFSISLNACDTYEDMHREIVNKFSDVPHLRDYYLCLFEDQNTARNGHYAEKITDTSRLIISIRNRRDEGMPMTSFPTRQLLPSAYTSSPEPQTFFVMLLHQRESVYGYSVLQYDPGHIPTLYFHHWNVIIANALNSISNQNKLRYLYEERRRSSITDTLTGLYNRRGLEEKLTAMLQAGRGKSMQAGFVFLDMDDLKHVNDTWGHAEGDHAICNIAAAVRRALPEDGFSCRLGGDEMFVCLPGADEDRCRDFVAGFTSQLELLMQLDQK
ncbi:MAG: hypothetical protein CW338_05135, partial [Clostridiales bacterium]|nr:hypothetical protein [Clostridiales bacterium]